MSKRPELDDTIGDILIDMGLIKRCELAGLIKEFENTQDELLGHFLVRKTKITEQQVEIALLRQKQLRGEVTRKVMMRAIEIADTNHKELISDVDSLVSVIAIAKANGSK